MVCSARVRARVGAILEDIVTSSGVNLRAAFLDRVQNLDQRVRGPAFALDAPDPRRRQPS